MLKTRVFKSGNSYAVRLPKKFRLSEDEVYIQKVGESLIITPIESGWDIMLKSLDEFTNDFMEERIQPGIQERVSTTL